MNLIIVESPTKARTLSKFLGKGYEIEATSGHIKDLPKSKLGIDVDHDFRPQYELLIQKTDIINGLVGAAKKASSIYLATDPDREGEAIASHVKELFHDSKISFTSHKLSRIVFHEITKEAVEDAIKNPKSVDNNLVDAQVARRVLDRLVGYKLSPLLWRKIRLGLSAGRVQTVTVRLIVEKEREIEKFVTEEYWEIFVQLTANSKQSTATFTVQLIKVGDKKAEIHKKIDASKIVTDLEKAKYKVLNVDKHEVRRNPYPPFTTSTMTQASARIYGWSAKRTMMIAQSLYEHGHITYHRTDSTNIASVAIDKARAFIKENYGVNYVPPNPRIYKTQSKVAQEAHEAIRPTNLNSKFKNSTAERVTHSKFKKEEETLYNLIWRRFVACQMESSVYDETVIDVNALRQARGKPIEYLLRASGQMMKFDGWKKVIPSKVDVEPAQTFPEVKSEDPLQLIKVDSFQKFTEPPARYTEASLIKMLEKLGIGRPSTYAPTISTIKIRNYVEKKEGKFYPTTVGIAVNDFLMKNFPDIFEYQFTADMENDLDSIANGETTWVKPIKKFWSPFKVKLASVTKKSKRVKIGVEKTGKKCPKCKKGELVIRIGRFGKFISCSTFPDCNYTEKYIEKAGMKCPKCKEGDVIIKKTSKGRNFFGCSRYPDCKWASWKKPSI